ncbi:MAG: flagellar hook-basal body complex protein FliE [Lachnospiraceae bacterium]|nr:flagellar hook-basal body complex protein FliE [Lachnospiraceae bacterium]
MDIASIANINKINPVQTQNRSLSPVTDHSGFDDLLSKAMGHLNTTNSYIQNAQNAEIRWALGESSSTHELTNAMQKSSIALQYTVAIRDKVLEAYKEIMQMQI